MAANLQPISSDGGFTSGGNINLDGNLNFTLNSVVYETNIPDGALSGSAIALKPNGGTSNNQQLLIYPTAADGDHIHLTSGNLYETELFLGSDNLYVKLANTGNVVINSNDGNSNTAMWTFDTTGNLTLPGNTFAINYANGTQVPLGGGGGNTGNVTFDDVAVQGASAQLFLSPDPTFTANLAYVRVRAGDVASHIHMDTGNNEAYDLFLGDDNKFVQTSSTGNIIMSSYDGNVSYAMTLDNTGNLTLPGQVRTTSVAGDGFPFDTTITNITTGNPTVVVTFATGIFGGAAEGLVQIYDVLGTDEINDTWWYQSTGVDEITLYTNSTFSTPVDGTTWNAYISGGKAVSILYNDLNIEAGTVFLGNPNRQWQFAATGEIVAPSDGTIFGQGTLTFEVPEGPDNRITSVINDAVTGTYSSWGSATYTDNFGSGKIDIVDSQGSLRRFVQLYMENANFGTATITINGEPTVLTYSGYNYNAGIFTIYVNQTPAVDPTTVTTITLNAVVRNVIELNDDNNQLNLESYSGWNVNIRSGYQGDVNINAGDDIFIRAGDKTTTDSTGGQIDLDAGDGGWADAYDSAGTGGDINVRGGGGGWASNAYIAGSGGTVNITGGQGGEANLTGLRSAGVGGPVEILGGFGGFNNGNISLGQQGGYVRIKGGDSTGELLGGRVDIEGGWGGPGFAGGNVTIKTTPDGGVTNYDWVFDNGGNFVLPRDGANSDPFLRIAGGANPRILSEDASLAGPANLEITALNTIFTGSSGSAIKIYADDGEIASDGNLQLWSNTAGNTQYSWTFGDDGNLTLPGNTFSINFANGSQAALSSIANGNSNVSIATANGNVTIAAVGNTTMTVTGTGANITGTLNATGNVTAQGTGSNLIRRAFGLVAADTNVTLDGFSAQVTSSSNQLSISWSGGYQITGWTETYTGGSAAVQNWVNLTSPYTFASGAMNSQGNGCRAIFSDQTPSATVYQVTVVRSGTTGSQWNISIERLV